MVHAMGDPRGIMVNNTTNGANLLHHGENIVKNTKTNMVPHGRNRMNNTRPGAKEVDNGRNIVTNKNTRKLCTSELKSTRSNDYMGRPGGLWRSDAAQHGGRLVSNTPGLVQFDAVADKAHGAHGGGTRLVGKGEEVVGGGEEKVGGGEKDAGDEEEEVGGEEEVVCMEEEEMHRMIQLQGQVVTPAFTRLEVVKGEVVQDEVVLEEVVLREGMKGEVAEEEGLVTPAFTRLWCLSLGSSLIIQETREHLAPPHNSHHLTASHHLTTHHRSSSSSFPLISPLHFSVPSTTRSAPPSLNCPPSPPSPPPLLPHNGSCALLPATPLLHPPLPSTDLKRSSVVTFVVLCLAIFLVCLALLVAGVLSSGPSSSSLTHHLWHRPNSSTSGNLVSYVSTKFKAPAAAIGAS